MKVFFRAYGSHLMGMGHLYRVAKIVKKLRMKLSDIHIVLWTKNYEESKEIYQNIKFDKIIENDKNISINDEIIKLKNYFLKNKFDVVINDELNTPKNLAEVLIINSSKSITFDDLGDGNYLFDYIINVLYPSNKNLKNEINNYEYMILEDYSKIKNKITFKKNVKTIFINQGAADTWGAIPDMITDLNNLKQDIKLKVLLGPSFKHFDELANALKNTNKEIEIINKTKNVIELVKDCDLAILGAGNTLFEVASLGIPIVSSTREEKELITIDRLLKDNIVFSENKIYTSGLYKLVKKVIDNIDTREKMFYQNRKLFNYNGLDKIINLIIKD